MAVSRVSKVVPHDSKSDLPLVSRLYLSRLATRILSKIAEMFFNLIAEKLAKPTCVHFYQVHYVLANLPFFIHNSECLLHKEWEARKKLRELS